MGSSPTHIASVLPDQGAMTKRTRAWGRRHTLFSRTGRPPTGVARNLEGPLTVRPLAGLILSTIAAAILVTAAPFGAPPALAQPATGASGLPLPRFVSLKARRVNLRIGPSRDYAVNWLYTRSGIPMEIIQEYDHWRRVRDLDGTVGWIHKSLLTGERTAAIAPWRRGVDDVFVPMRSKPQRAARAVARLEPGVIVRIQECNGKWCEAEVDGIEGWVAQDEIWGAYPGEAFR